MRPIRYVGRHRNAGIGYSLVQRCRREAANYLGFNFHLHRLAYLVDFDRDRFAVEYLEQDRDDDDDEDEGAYWDRLDQEHELDEPLNDAWPFTGSGGAGSPRDQRSSQL